MAKKSETKSAASKAEDVEENGTTEPILDDDAVEAKAEGAKKRGRPAKTNGTKTATKPAKGKKAKKATSDDDDENSANGDAEEPTNGGSEHNDDDEDTGVAKPKKGRGRPPKAGKAKPKVSSGRPRGRPKKV